MNLPNAMTVGRTYSEYLGEECEPEFERCYYCYGDGIVDAMQNDDGEVLSMTCPKCHGKGEIEA